MQNTLESMNVRLNINQTGLAEQTALRQLHGTMDLQHWTELQIKGKHYLSNHQETSAISLKLLGHLQHTHKLRKFNQEAVKQIGGIILHSFDTF